MTENKAEILNPKTDRVFKLMFSKGEEGNKALISFLNAFLKETYGAIHTADILNTELTRESPNGETYHLDLLVKTDNGLIIYVALNELIGYTIAKDIADYTAKDFWIQFLSNYAEDKQSGILKKLCALEEGLEMAEATLFKVTEEERRIAWELSTRHYYDILADERAEGAYQKALETARLMRLENLGIDLISKVTGLSEAEIAEL